MYLIVYNSVHILETVLLEKKSHGRVSFSSLHRSSNPREYTKHLAFASIICCDTDEQKCHHIFCSLLQKCLPLWRWLEIKAFVSYLTKR